MPSAHPSSRVFESGDLKALGTSLAARYETLIGEGVPAHLAMPVRKMQMQEPKRVPLPSARAIVVEDDPHVRVLAELLLDEIAVVIGCESAESALAVMRARGQDVALVFADVRLTGTMSGIDLACAVVSRWPATRMMLTSGVLRAPPSDLPAGVRFLPKPWSCADLLAEARSAIRRP